MIEALPKCRCDADCLVLVETRRSPLAPRQQFHFAARRLNKRTSIYLLPLLLLFGNEIVLAGHSLLAPIRDTFVFEFIDPTVGRPGRPGRTDRSGRPGRPGRTGRSGRSAEREKTSKIDGLDITKPIQCTVRLGQYVLYFVEAD